MSETPEQVEKISIPVAQLENLLKQNEEYKAEIANLLKVAYGICNVLGLTDANGKVKENYLNGEDSPMPSIMKAIMGTISLMGQASVPGLGKNAEKQIAERFAFIKYLVPIINKYQQK